MTDAEEGSGGSLLDTDKMKSLREAAGLTQEQAALQAGFKGRQAWSNFESGQQTRITLRTLARLAAVLKVQPRDLLKDEPAASRRGGKKKGNPRTR